LNWKITEFLLKKYAKKLPENQSQLILDEGEPAFASPGGELPNALIEVMVPML